MAATLFNLDHGQLHVVYVEDVGKAVSGFVFPSRLEKFGLSLELFVSLGLMPVGRFFHHMSESYSMWCVSALSSPMY